MDEMTEFYEGPDYEVFERNQLALDREGDEYDDDFGDEGSVDEADGGYDQEPMHEDAYLDTYMEDRLSGVSSRRPEAEIVGEIARTYGGLSPENLWRDGEATKAEARSTERRLTKRLRELFRELGRTIDECEAYALDRRMRGGRAW